VSLAPPYIHGEKQPNTDINLISHRQAFRSSPYAP
jgi:hypothetical protein